MGETNNEPKDDGDAIELMSITLIGVNNNGDDGKLEIALLKKPGMEQMSPLWVGLCINDRAMVLPAVPFLKAIHMFLEKSQEHMVDACASELSKLMMNRPLTDEEKAELEEIKKKLVR